MNNPKATQKPKPEFFSKRVGIATVAVSGVAWYWFAYRPWAKNKKHQELEAQAREIWLRRQAIKDKQQD